ncbi:MAG TPA: diaminopimelate decarboxylase [Terriglobia bacterium]|nr:diaminopimelate decarboxylase [Terriglobia bacterium]
METFQYRDGRFFCEEVPVESIAERFGTPTYVYSRNRILENFRRLVDGFRDISCLVCYSVKANSNLAILRLLREAGAGFDIVSGGELARVERVGANPRAVVFSGVGKTASEIDAALRARILMFNVESAGELEMIESRVRGAASPEPPGISIRINPNVAAETHPYISTGETIHKFGVAPEEALELYCRAAASPYLKVRGIACHIGSQILAVEPFVEALDQVLAVAQRLRALGIGVEDVDLGGGFGIRYAAEPPLDVNRLAREIIARVRGASYRLILEPGRALVGDAGILVTRVLYVKQNPLKNFVITDAGMNDLMRPALYGSYHEIVAVGQSSEKRVRADVVGPLCETGDFLARDRELPEAKPGELLALLNAGAYGYVLASNYNTRPRSAEVLVDGEQIQLVGRRESVEELMSRETP